MRLGVLWILFSALSPPPLSYITQRRWIPGNTRRSWGGGVRRAGGDEIFCVLMQFFDESADRIRIEDLYSNTPPCDCDSGRDPLSLGT